VALKLGGDGEALAFSGAMMVPRWFQLTTIEAAYDDPGEEWVRGKTL
jgi:hypothetical protein